MSEPAPDLHMLNVIVGDMPASLDFYRRLGAAVPGESASGAHVQLRMPSGFSLELDTAESARAWHAGWRADPASARVVIGFSLPSREAVDERYAELTSAGYLGRQPPFDDQLEHAAGETLGEADRGPCPLDAARGDHHGSDPNWLLTI